jgi:hypothetical protein
VIRPAEVPGTTATTWDVPGTLSRQLSAALAASFAVAALIREVGLTHTLLIVGLGFSAIALAGIRPLVKAESRTAGGADTRAMPAISGEPLAQQP